MIAAGSSSPLDRVRAKLEEAFGQFELAQTPTPQAGAEEDIVATLTRAIDRTPARRARVPEARVDRGRDAARSSPTGSSAACPTGTSTPGTSTATRRAATASTARGRAKLLTRRASLPREGFEPRRAPPRDDAPASGTRRTSRAGRSRRAPGRSSTAPRSRERPVGSADWLVGEVLSFRGEAVVLDAARAARSSSRRGRASSSAGCARRARRPRPDGRRAESGAVPVAERQGEGEGRAAAPGSELTSSVPPWASAIARAM